MYYCTYIIYMDYQWDPKKAKNNLEKHGVAFADAISVFCDEFALTIEDDNPDEQRFVTIGMDALSRIIVVVFTWRNDSIRIISARKATRRERKQYEEIS